MNKKIWLVALLTAAALTGRAELRGRGRVVHLASDDTQSAEDFLTESQQQRLYETADRMKDAEMPPEILPEPCRTSRDSKRCLIALILLQLKARQAANKVRLSR